MEIGRPSILFHMHRSVARHENDCLEFLSFKNAALHWNLSFKLVHCIRGRRRFQMILAATANLLGLLLMPVFVML